MDDYIVFDHVSKAFSGNVVLDDVAFGIWEGEIHAIIGENGAGKSTLLNILHGVFPATKGSVFIGGKKVRFANARDAIEYGIAKVHQEINCIQDMTVAENMFIGGEPVRMGLLDRRVIRRETQALLEKLKCPVSPDDLMSDLSAGQKQMVAIAKALKMNARVISFDEPTASLSDAEVRVLFDIIRELKSRGITILYISHKMDEIFTLCDRATVLRDGKYVRTARISDTTREEIIASMVGRDLSTYAKRTLPCQADVNARVLQVENLSGRGFRDVSFTLHKGEILGFFGLVGAGRTEVMRAIYGADKVSGGKITLHGAAIVNKTPNQAIGKGIALIAENRKEQGIVPNLDNKDNIALPCLERFRRGGFVDAGLKRRNAVAVGARVGLTPNDPDFMTAMLSGGNAQKVMLARWITTESEVMIFDEPTKGIDIGAKAEIYKLIEQLAAKGHAIIIVSSELMEVMGICDRLVIMHEGRKTAEFDRTEYSEESILQMAVEG